MRLLVTGGGTGGHLYPGVAIAQELLSRGGHEVIYAGSPSGIEARVLPGLGLEFAPVTSGGIVGKGLAGKVKGLLSVLKGFGEASALIRRFKPDATIGVGGYVSFPVVAWSALRGVPSAIQEQNAKAGLANRVLGKLVRSVFLGDEGAKAEFPEGKAVLTGNPLRAVFSSPKPYEIPGEGAVRVLVLGGSQGARSLNTKVPEAIRSIGSEVEVVHQCGKGNLEEVKVRYGDMERVKVVEFIEEMDEAYGRAQIVIARAGALTVAELAASARPALLIPFPYAAGNHQEANARSAEARGAAICLTENELTPEAITEQIKDWLDNPAKLSAMADAAANSANTRAAANIVDNLLALAGEA
ncbi:MAG: undecaprenyldiphospho-muramoylpentapeptide beta-N-acetylglucosaminyltransferase [Deltaproteobacteria bacterium]|nr:MAG: undecaprenyldiphospho-muramoylpentapeptide beta-N-acetylglucosaminyltransferase [Deltaproteobacteria bacterium]